MSEQELILSIAHWTQHGPYEMEMQRRLFVSQEALISELKRFEESSATANTRLLRATWVLVVLTVVIAALTVVLLLRG